MRHARRQGRQGRRHIIADVSVVQLVTTAIRTGGRERPLSVFADFQHIHPAGIPGLRGPARKKAGSAMRFLRPLLIAAFAGPMIAALPARAAQEPDYRSRTLYFLMADRFHAHEPWAPYVDPAHPDATNDVNCFAIPCRDETQWRKYWGGDIRGISDKLDYLKRLGISGIWIT